MILLLNPCVLFHRTKLGKTPGEEEGSRCTRLKIIAFEVGTWPEERVEVGNSNAPNAVNQ